MSSGDTHVMRASRVKSSRLIERRTSLSPILDIAFAAGTSNQGSSHGNREEKSHGPIDDDVDARPNSSFKNPSKNEVILDDNEKYMYDSCYEEDFNEPSMLAKPLLHQAPAFGSKYEDNSQKFDKIPDLHYSSTYLAASSNEKEKFYVIGHKMDVPRVSQQK